jgi:putative ABC transport system ATP-binding protein
VTEHRPPGEVLVRCEDVARTFGTGIGAVVAVRRVSCQVPAGAQLAITGPSGSGKSTLLHLLAGLDLPTLGTVTWPALGGRSALRHGAVGLVFQGPSLLAPLDVLENVALPLLLGGATEEQARVAADGALDRLGLRSLRAKLPDELSGGQSQRVAVARVLAGEPRLILADEPTGQLDHTTAMSVIAELLASAAATGAALVVSTHDPRVAERFPERWDMVDGELCVPGMPSRAGATSSS